MTSRARSWLIIFGSAAIYGLICRLLFAWQPLEGWLQIVSASFIYTMPFSLGALVCFLGYKLDDPCRFWACEAPLISILILLAGSVLIKLEALFCVLLAAPVVVPATLLGGWIMSLVLRRFDGGRMQLALWLLLPFAVSPVEQMWRAPDETRIMRDSVVIRASPAQIWDQIKSVPAIQPAELPWRWIYALGFPRPLAATLDHEGVGGKRHATFEREVSFHEVVTRWEPPRKLSFTIKADPDFLPRNAFDEHIIVGGRFYDVLDGTYEIEVLSDGTCVLHLWSTHRLSTSFNSYAGWWSERVMHQIQGSILHVIRARCESKARES